MHPPHEEESKRVWATLEQCQQADGQTFNLFAVVVSCGPCTRTRRDWMRKYRVADPTTADSGGVTLLAFADHPHLLHEARSVGRDVIRLHNVKAQRFNGQPQLVGTVGWQGFAYWLYGGGGSGSSGGISGGGGADEPPPAAAAGAAPYAGSDHPPPATQHAARLLGVLGQHAAALAGVAGAANPFSRRLCDLAPAAETYYADLRCKVVARTYGDEGQLQVLYVWDGTELPPEARASQSATQEAAAAASGGGPALAGAGGTQPTAPEEASGGCGGGGGVDDDEFWPGGASSQEEAELAALEAASAAAQQQQQQRGLSPLSATITNPSEAAAAAPLPPASGAGGGGFWANAERLNGSGNVCGGGGGSILPIPVRPDPPVAACDAPPVGAWVHLQNLACVPTGGYGMDAAEDGAGGSGGGGCSALPGLRVVYCRNSKWHRVMAPAPTPAG